MQKENQKNNLSIGQVDTLRMSGVLTLRGYDLQGNLVLKDDGHNMIMEAAKVTLANLIGGDGSEQVVTSIAFGNDISTPAPDNTQISGIDVGSLTSGINNVEGVLAAYLKNLSGHTYPTPGYVKFSWVLSYGEANGLPITEFGLITSGGTMFARKTRGVITKEADLELYGDWTIRF